jgi:RNA polymerase sigma factor (TIGR02999 family)
MPRDETFRKLLDDVGRGDQQASERLLATVYDELHRVARGLLAKEAPGISLQATMLVNDVWMNLNGAGGNDAAFENRRHFFGAAARAMRRLLVDHARARAAERRGGKMLRVTFVDPAGRPESNDFALLALHEVLEQLEIAAPAAARVVEMRYFAGLSLEETAVALDRSPSTVKREWTYARAWLHDRLPKDADV